MIVFPNAKINIGLNIVEKREDGYHNLESCFYPVLWNDILEIVESKKLSFNCTGIPIPGDSEDNLCMKAYSIFHETYDIPPVDIHLHKAIPTGAGLGGGSSNAASTLMVLNALFDLDISDKLLVEYAQKLGADCAFFIKNEPCFVRGTGATFAPIDLSLAGKWITLVKPQFSVNTKKSFSLIEPKATGGSLKERLEDLPIDQWGGSVVNDFQKIIFEQHPELPEIRETLLAKGAVYTSMSGTGSTVYGIFEEKKDWLAEFKGCMVHQVRLR